MVKQKLNVSDISVLINEFNSHLYDCRLVNVYDINSRCFLLKFNKDNGDRKDKEFVLVDSNPQSPRFHITKQEYLCNANRRTLPSSFCNKLRKHLTNKRITKITQLGMDRIVDFQFGKESIYHIIIELYDSGNLVLTDENYNILTLVRRYNLNKDQEDELNIKVGVKYPIENANSIIIFDDDLNEKLNQLINNIDPNKKTSLRNIFISGDSPIVHFGKDMILHSVSKMGWNLNKKYNNVELQTFDINNFIFELKEVNNQIKNAKGYIIKDKESKIDFTPILYNQYLETDYIEYSTLNQAIDQYFIVNTDQMKKDEIKTEKKAKDSNKIERVENSIKEKIVKLDKDREESLKIADYLSNNIYKFDFLNSFDPNNYDNINIKINSINKKDKTLEYYIEELDMNVDLDYTQNIWNNIKNYHTNKKDIKNKINKTEVSGKKALDRLKSEEKKIVKKEIKLDHELVEVKEFWFQKFKWFISSEGFLVILGKDMHQNEMIVKKHLDKNDIYLHSDVHGSGSCVIKDIITDDNNEPSIKTIIEASSFIICNSKAWKSNSPDKAFWVYPDQVSKTPQTGEYVSTGSFIIRGKKNYVTTSLQLGYGILFKIPGEMNLKSITIKSQDIMDWAIPMIGPYSSFKDFKFKAKLLPGNGKKGKTYKKIIDTFIKKKEITNIEKVLIKNIDNGFGSDILVNGINYIS